MAFFTSINVATKTLRADEASANQNRFRPAQIHSAPGVSGFVRAILAGGRGHTRNTITGIAQTPDGYLWLAKHFRLVRFDGVRFTTFGAEVLPLNTNPPPLALGQ